MKLIVHLKSNVRIEVKRNFKNKNHLRETGTRIGREGLLIEEHETGEKKEEFYPPEQIYKVTMLL